MNWIKKSNRPKHLLYAIPAGALFTILFVAGLAAGMSLRTGIGVENGIGLILWQH
jgi:hypothetical protein